MGNIRKIDDPEMKIQVAIEEKLTLLGWYVKRMHGSLYQSGVPDLYVAHISYGQRWLEIKNPLKYEFTTAQLKEFHLMAAARVGIWIATDVLQVPDLLFKPPNWHLFLPALSATSRRA